MKKIIKCLLLISLVLGFLQLETSAMTGGKDEEEQNSHFNMNPAPTVKPTENVVTEWREDNRINDLLSNYSSILQRMEQLTQENISLNKKVNELQEQLNPSKPLKAILKNYTVKFDFMPYTSGRKPITFDIFEGEDERMKGENLSFIKIPEDGMYSLVAHYYWHAKNEIAAPYTAIAINNPDNIMLNYFVHPHLTPGYASSDCLNRVTRLKKGDKVMVILQGAANAEYCPAHFQLDVEKIH